MPQVGNLGMLQSYYMSAYSLIRPACPNCFVFIAPRVNEEVRRSCIDTGAAFPRGFVPSLPPQRTPDTAKQQAAIAGQLWWTVRVSDRHMQAEWLSVFAGSRSASAILIGAWWGRLIWAW